MTTAPSPGWSPIADPHEREASRRAWRQRIATRENRLADLAWGGRMDVMALSYACMIRWTDPATGAMMHDLFAPFVIDDRDACSGWPPHGVDEWSVVDFGPGDSRPHALFLDGHQRQDCEDLEELIENLLWGFNQRLLQAATDYVMVHAGAVLARDGTALLLPGTSGSGKSSLTAALTASGFGYLSDEFAPIDPVSGRVHPFPRPITVKPGPARALLAARTSGPMPTDEDAHWHLRAADLGGATPRGPQVIAHVVFPRYQADAPARLTPMSRAEAVLELARNCPRLPHVYRGRALPLMARIMADAAGWRLTSGDLPGSVGAIHRLYAEHVGT